MSIPVSHKNMFTLLFILLLVGISLAAASPAQSLKPTVTVSGTVTGPGGPVADVTVNISSETEWYNLQTDSNGDYSAVVQTDGLLWFYIRPDVGTRLGLVNLHRSGVNSNITQDFELVAGHLVELTTPVNDAWMEFQPLFGSIPNGQWYSLDYDWEAQAYRGVLPADIYAFKIFNVPDGYYPTYANIDLRNGDHIEALSVNTSYEHPINYDAPDTSKISFTPTGTLGEVTVTGTAASVLPLAHVMVVNLNSGHKAFAVSEGDGSFTATIFGPPGSNIMIKHGRTHQWDWKPNIDEHGGLGPLQNLNMYPTTQIHIPHTHTAPEGAIPFATVGSSNLNNHTTPFHVPAAWDLSGSMSTAQAMPNDTVTVDSKMRLYSHAIDGSTNLASIDVGGWVALAMISDANGNPVPVRNQHGSVRLTSSGLPISHDDSTHVWIGQQVNLTNLQYLGGNIIIGDADFTFQIPENLPEGIYRPVIGFYFNNIPESDQWPATSPQFSNFWYQEGVLPPIAVSHSTTMAAKRADLPTRLTWALLMNNPSAGQRGTLAREDMAHYQPTSLVVTQGAPYVAPAYDHTVNQMIEYRLEPFLPMISYSDRLPPSQPLIPFDLPGGELCVSIEEPDGQTRDLGCGTFQQAAQQTPSSKSGQMLNNGSIQIDDIYSLTTGDDQFVTTFTKYGHHTITMTGLLTDIWGNEYEGGGTYDVWVAQPLDLDFGVLPGTPFDVGDQFNPALTVHPHVPAEVTLTITHYPYSDATQKVEQTIAGTANQYGYFSSLEDSFVFQDPGEYRVDVSAVYTDTLSGRIYQATARWGGIVMTPPEQANLIAHGRRGLDNLEYIPNQWFTTCGLSPPAPAGSVSHVLTPYFSGDIIWSRLEPIECDGFALRLAASVQDTDGSIESRLIERFNRTYHNLQPPGDFNERVNFDELPLFTSTTSGQPAQVYPDDIDQIAYAYLSAQRPGVRVREVIAEDGQSSGYWRLDSRYDNQLGVGLEGDLPNDFKFQYIGAVYRDLAFDIQEYVGHGSGWIHLPDDDPTGSRVMPPFAGPGNGGWPTVGGPLMTLKGEDIHMFILPTGVHPGSVLEVGDTLHFAGHIMPTLASQVEVQLTAPSGQQYLIQGQANSIGYFYDEASNLVVNEEGLWLVDVKVWHDDQIGSGELVNCNENDPFNSALPCPSGNVLGSAAGQFPLYVVAANKDHLAVSSPTAGYLPIHNNIAPIMIEGTLPDGLTNVSVDYLIRMPGFILEQGQASIDGNQYSITFDPETLHNHFPNLDLRTDDWLTGLEDTFTISLLLRAEVNEQPVTMANVVSMQAQLVHIGQYVDPNAELEFIYLPLATR